MKLLEVINSSSVKRIEYDEDKFELSVKYTSGATYKYMGIKPEVYDKLVLAESKGKFIASEIKGKYCYANMLSPNKFTI